MFEAREKKKEESFCSSSIFHISIILRANNWVTEIYAAKYCH